MFDQTKADRICELLAEGKSLRASAKEVGVCAATVLNWTEDDVEFGKRYAHTRARAYQLLADEIIEISDDASGDTLESENGPRANPEFTARARLRVDSRKWMLAKMLPKVYGDKIDVNAVVTASVVIQATPQDEAL